MGAQHTICCTGANEQLNYPDVQVSEALFGEDASHYEVNLVEHFLEHSASTTTTRAATSIHDDILLGASLDHQSDVTASMQDTPESAKLDGEKLSLRPSSTNTLITIPFAQSAIKKTAAPKVIPTVTVIDDKNDGAVSPQMSSLKELLLETATNGICEVIKDRLYWAPGCTQLSSKVSDRASLFSLAETTADKFLMGGAYHVMHYGPEALGKTFGPPSLVQIIRFCQIVKELGDSGPGCVVVSTGQDEPSRMNASVFLGAYLVFIHNQPVATVQTLFRQYATLCFPCPWNPSLVARHNLKVSDCWAGLEMASKKKWLTGNMFITPSGMETACVELAKIWETYDASWLVPHRVMVSADPITTINDPNPMTCHAFGKTPAGWVGKKKDAASRDQMDFLSWSKAQNIKLVVRSNFSNEGALKELGGSYVSNSFTSIGIAHLEVPVKDTKGGVPDENLIVKMLDSCKAHAKDSAVLVHCKAGFGRSVFFACCWIISSENVPGRALLGWVRMARPGSITTPEQEHFLCKLSGSSSLEELLRPIAQQGSQPGKIQSFWASNV